MQNFRLRKIVYQTSKIDEEEYSKEAYERYEKLNLYGKLRKEGCKESTALEAINMPRSTYYRWKKKYRVLGLVGLEEETRRPNKVRGPLWTLKSERLVVAMRKKYPLWGKHKLSVMLKRKNITIISASTIGRILKKLVDAGRVRPVYLAMGKREVKRRNFTGHARRWRVGMKSGTPGELIQVDHMSIQLPCGKNIKHFTSVCPITKIVVEQAYSRACSNTASRFLEKIINDYPFKVNSIQVDGGSEFMGMFEKSCQSRDIALFVLPPRSPEYNGHVERGNGTVKYEFYHQYVGSDKLTAIQSSLQQYAKFYNEVRPHQGLNYLTPFEYYSELTK